MFLLLLLFWLRFCFKHKKWLIDYCSTVATKTNNFSSFPWCIWRGRLRPPSVMSLVFLVQFLFWVGKHSDAHTQIHTKKPIELKCWQVISYFIRGISCHPLVQHFVCSNFVCICGTNILLIQCCEFGCCCCYCFVCLLLCEANQLQWSYHFEHVCWFFFLISCHLLFMLGNFFVSFFHLFSSAFIDLRCTKNETNFKSSQKNSKNTENESKRERKKKWYAHLSIYNQFSASP